MQTIQTDDPARRNVFSWKGPVELPFITEMRMPAVAAGLLFCPIFAFVGWVLTPFIEWLPWGNVAYGVLARAALGAGSGFILAILLIRKGGQHIDPVRPIRYHIANNRYELEVSRIDTSEQTTETTYDKGAWIEQSGLDRTTTRVQAPAFLGEAAEAHHLH